MGTGTVLLREIAERDHLSVESDASLREVIRLMHRNGKGVVVLLREGKPAGVLTERDAVALLHEGVDLDETAYGRASKSLVQTSSERSIGYALNLMLENNIRRLIVVGHAGDFVGIITQRDLLRQLEEDCYRSSLRVEHILGNKRELVTGARRDAIRVILERMVRHRISSVPIVEGGQATGIVTEKDILKLANDDVCLENEVGLYMSHPVISAGLETPVVLVVKMMDECQIRRVLVNDQNGRALGIITHTDLVRNLEVDYSEFLERKLKYTKEVLNLLPEMMVEVIDTGQEQLMVWANEKVLSRFGHDILDRPVTGLVPKHRWAEIYAALWNEQKVEDVRFKNDDVVYELSGFYLPLDKASERGRIQLILRDITEEVLLATTDSLTSIYNRRYMNEFLSKELDRCSRTGRQFSICVLDVDDFKKINDAHGHATGDAVLREIAEVLLDSVRKYDIVGRYGGEEFLVIMPEIGKRIAAGVAQRLRQQIERHKTKVNGHCVSVTASFGVASFDQDGSSPDDLFLRADERLYRAKRRGKNQVVSD